MVLFKKYVFVFLIGITTLINKQGYAQIYPVQISTQLIPPYSGYLPDYADPSSEKLKVILQFNDFTVAQYNLRLKIEIKGNGFSLVTKAFYNPPPITLQPGQPLLLSGSDLAPYLSSSNLDFIGINQSAYEQRMALPEGFYSICVKAYDYYASANTQVSNDACAQAWFTFSNPPLLNIPFCNSALTPLTPQSVLFQWSPVNIGSPNSAFNTYYDFMLYEVRPDSNANVNQLVLSTAPIYSVTTQQTFINYGISEPNLNVYMKYVWRVRVRDASGRDWFINDGYSQICTFNYGTAKSVLGNAIALNLNTQGISHRLGKANWNMQTAYTSYRLQVRKENTLNWFDYNTAANTEKITNLEPNTTYECRVRGEGALIGDWSNTSTFTTLGPPNYNCNNQNILPDALTPQPLPPEKAIAGLILQSGQFEITTETIKPSGPAGWYSGTGIVNVFGVLPIAVKWNNIYIDDNNRHQQGIIEALSKGVDKWTHQWDVIQAEENAHYTNGTIDSIYVNGEQVCYILEGSSLPICVPTQSNTNVMVVRDGEGNQYTIQLIPAPPKIIDKTNYLNYSADSLDTNDSLKVEFKVSNAQTFGFDEKQYAAFIKNYEVIKLKNGKNYFVPNKSIGQSASDEVLAILTVTNFTPNALRFKTENGTDVQNTNVNNNTFILSNIQANTKAVYAWYNGKKIGKLNTITFKNIHKKLILVPINNAQVTVASSDLDSIFKQANITWSVSTAPSFTFNLGNDGLETADATLMSKYSMEMRALRNAYKQWDTLYDKNAYYIFVVPNFSNPNVQGYMVRGRALGFITPLAFTNKQGVRLLAHELAHGAFALEHTFPKIEKSTSNNLMDYTGGKQLVLEQWEKMHSNKFTYNWLDEEEDGSYLGPNNTASNVFYWINKIKVAYKNNKTVSVPKNNFMIGRASACYLGGVQYDSICVYVQNKTNDYNAEIKNKVTIGNRIKSVYGIPVTYSCVLIDDGKIAIEVPVNRLKNMLFYIQNTQTFKNLILFVNGYRPIVNKDGDKINPITLEYPNSDNQVEHGDSRNYWKGIDAQFMNRIGTRNAVYADGHHSVATSNHYTTIKYADGNAKSLILKQECSRNPLLAMCLLCGDDFLHTNPKNYIGFNIRKNNGIEAGKDLVSKINQGIIVFNKITDTLDVVSHSMGYAYSLGMIEELKKANIHFGRCYIIAPENPSASGINWGYFNEVWQYGSNLGESNQDPLWDQDGVAPQSACTGLELLPNNKTNGGRVYIPNGVPKGFLESHTIGNYGWIFTERTIGKTGYVKPRN